MTEGGAGPVKREVVQSMLLPTTIYHEHPYYHCYYY